MKCEWVRENILLFVYNELADDTRYELEQHVARCADCAAELKATRKFHVTLSSLPVEEPTPNLLAASRMRLQEALETTEQGGDRKSTRLNSSHRCISYAVFCLKKKNTKHLLATAPN